MSFQERASDIIYAAGGRMTPQRRLLLDLLASTAVELDAEALYQLARQHDSTLSLATVYRTLKLLEEGGILQPRYYSPEHERKFYETPQSQAQYYFTCRTCRRVIPFSPRSIPVLKSEVEAALGVSVESACICLNGLCPTCLTMERQNS